LNWGRLLSDLGIGTRVVVRYRIESGFTDALGVLVTVDDLSCIVQTRRGPVTIALPAVVAAKAVPPPPVPRPRRLPEPR